MTTPTADDALLRYTDTTIARPIPAVLRNARGEVLAAVRDLSAIADSTLARPWPWKGGSEDELRYGFYRIGEVLEVAAIDAAAAMRAVGIARGRAADLAGPATAARWDLQGLVATLPDALWDADPGGGEWTVRLTLGHVIASQLGYGIGTAWWQHRAIRADDPRLPETSAPAELWDALPSEETVANGSPAEARSRLDDALDRSTERLAGLPDERLALGARWSGFAVDVGFRIGRWSSHIREHTIQVEKTLAMVDHRPTEVDRLIRLVLAAWGRAEAVVYGSADADDALRVLASAAADVRSTAADLVNTARI